jgi:hypothetical protein
MSIFVYCLTLLASIGWEVNDDQAGDVTGRWKDIGVRSFLWSLSTVAATELFYVPWFVALALQLAVFVLLFDYLVAYYLIRKGTVQVKGAHWFSYLSKKKWTDQLQAWANPWARLVVKLAVFVAALWWFVTY